MTLALPDPETDTQFYDGVPAKRLLAFVIDVALIWGIALVIGILTVGIGFLLFGWVLVLVDFAYRVMTISSQSATIGMRMVGIEIRDDAGDRLTTPMAFLHTILFFMVFAFFIIQLVSVLMMAGSRFGRGLHDFPLRTAMINRPL